MLIGDIIYYLTQVVIWLAAFRGFAFGNLGAIDTVACIAWINLLLFSVGYLLVLRYAEHQPPDQPRLMPEGYNLFTALFLGMMLFGYGWFISGLAFMLSRIPAHYALRHLSTLPKKG